MQVALWVLGIVLIDHSLGGWIRTAGDHLFPSTVLGHYPLSMGWLHWFDIVFGLGLDTYTEEVVFRRCARHVFKPYLGDGLLLVFGHVAAVRRLSLVVGGRKYPSSGAHGRSVHVVLPAVWIVVASRA
jgi:hypothetical protein